MRFVVWIWKGSRKYEPEHVNHLYRQLRRQCRDDFSLVCISDELRGFEPGIEVIKTPPAAMKWADLSTPERPHFPSCYRRLWMFSDEARTLGDRVMLIDVDLVVTANPSPLWTMKEDFVGWRPLRTWGRENRFGGGIYLLTLGARTHVWERFNGQDSIDEARRAGLRGSDQAWLSYCLANSEACWPQNSGIYSIRDLTRQPIPQRGRLRFRRAPLTLPPDALIVQFNGPDKPWCPRTQQRHEWLQAHCA